MATIVRTFDASDGHDVTFATGGRQYTLHFPTVPSEAARDEAILGFEQQVLDELVEDKSLDVEESDHEL